MMMKNMRREEEYRQSKRKHLSPQDSEFSSQAGKHYTYGARQIKEELCYDECNDPIGENEVHSPVEGDVLFDWNDYLPYSPQRKSTVNELRDVTPAKAVPSIENDHTQSSRGKNVGVAAASDVNLRASSSLMSEPKDASSTSGTRVARTNHDDSKVDFHGFQILSQYAEHLERVYSIEGEFWSTSMFKSVDATSAVLEILGQALALANIPRRSISLEQLKLMLQLMDDVRKAGFKLECFNECTSRAKTFSNTEADKSQIEAELGEIADKIGSLQQKMKSLRNRKGKLQGKLDVLYKIRNSESSPLDSVFG